MFAYRRTAGALASVVATLSSSAAFAEESILGKLPKDISEYGHRIDWLLNITIVFIAILFAVMCGWMLYAMIFHNSRHPAHYDHGDGKRSPLLALGIAAGVFVIVDGNLFVNSTIDMGQVIWNFDMADELPGRLRIEVNARQWLWQARYAGPDGEFNTEDDAVTTNDIRVPIDTPVIMQIGAADVIHNLYIPNLRIKADAMPGSIAKAWFTAKETGVYEIACAQHCGANHYKMRALLTVLSKEDFATWLEKSVDDSKQVYSADGAGNWGWKWKGKGS